MSTHIVLAHWIFIFSTKLMLPLLGALSTFVSLDLDVAQEYLRRLTQM